MEVFINVQNRENEVLVSLHLWHSLLKSWKVGTMQWNRLFWKYNFITLRQAVLAL